MKKNKQLRYRTIIQFKGQTLLNHTLPIVEDSKSFKKANAWKDLIDNTVTKAWIEDNVTGKVTWLKEEV